MAKDTQLWTAGASRGTDGNVGDGSISAGDRTKELGVSGLKGARPIEGWLYEEFLPQLRGLRGAQIYRQMGDNDPVLGAALFTFKMLLTNVPWTAEPADASSSALEAKDWVESVLFRDMVTPWGDVMEDCLSMLQYGFAPMEVTYKVRRGDNRDVRRASESDDGTIGIAKISTRAQDTVWRWHFDAFSDVRYLEQFRIGQVNAMIPVEKLLLFRTDASLNNPEGRSLLRTCYTTFVRKNTIEEAEGRAAIRNAGLVVMRIPAQLLDPGASDEEKAIANAYKAIADKVAKDEMGAVVLPSDVDPNTKSPMYALEYTIAQGTRPVNMSEIVERYDKRMLSAMLADFILLGQQSVGSFALSDSKTAMFGKACGSILGKIKDQINRVLLTRLWKLNGFDPKVKPTVSHGDLEAVDLDKLGMFILRLAQGGAEIFPDPELQQKLLEFVKLKQGEEG